MKKNFSLISANHRTDRVAESVKAEINKYLARERRKTLPEGVDYWDFNCKCGASADTAEVIKVTEFSKSIDKVSEAKSENVYIEILAKPGIRNKRPVDPDAKLKPRPKSKIKE